MKMQDSKANFTLPLRYMVSKPVGEGLVILLHGYQDNAQSMLKRIGWQDMELPFQWLALNAPFPVPIWNAEGFKEAYGWYFRDTSRDLVIVRPQETAVQIAKFLKELGFENTPKVFFGFSQGGYLAPYIANHTQNVRSIIGLGCGFNAEAYDLLNPVEVHAIHGSKDERINLPQSRSEHAALKARGFGGEFHTIANLDHRVDIKVEPLVRELAANALNGKSK